MVVSAGNKTRGDSYPGSVRIIGGKWRGRRLPVAEGEGLRPTPNRIRETIFNWLRPWIAGARCLDVTAGTGSLCLEALSQGAGSAVMLEKNPLAVQFLRSNVATLAAENVDVMQTDAVDFLAGSPSAFDIVFLDPPFRSQLIAECAQLLEQRGWLKPQALIYIEAPAAVVDLPIPDSWHVIKSKIAGQVGYHLIKRELADKLI